MDVSDDFSEHLFILWQGEFSRVLLGYYRVGREGFLEDSADDGLRAEIGNCHRTPVSFDHGGAIDQRVSDPDAQIRCSDDGPYGGPSLLF
jgi:hypothetical protein